MEWIMLGILSGCLGTVLYFYPKAKIVLITSVIQLLRQHEAAVVQASYNSLPQKIRDKVDSESIVAIVAAVLSFGMDAVEKNLRK